MTILPVYIRYRRVTPTITSGMTTTNASRNPTVPAMTLLLFETDPDGVRGGGTLDDIVLSHPGTAYKYMTLYIDAAHSKNKWIMLTYNVG